MSRDTTRARRRLATVTELRPRILDLYCRISVDYDGTTRSVDDQEEDLKDHLEFELAQQGWVLGEVFKDPFLSAWKPTVVRPDFETMMKRLESGASNGVAVYDLTRFTRKPMEGERLLTQANREDVGVFSLTTAYNLRTADGRSQFRDAMRAGAHESDKISERSSRGKLKKARRGKTNATVRGFARDGYLPNPKGWQPGDPRTRVDPGQLARERAAVRDAAERLIAGEACMVIAEEWNAKQLWTVRGDRWDGGRLRDMLMSPAIGGCVEYKGDIVAETGGGPLDRETWERLVMHFESRKRGRPVTRYLLSGLVTCGKCGGRIYGRPLGHPYKPYDDGEVRRQYWCQVQQKSGEGCGGVGVDQRHADAVVAVLTIERLNDPAHAQRVARVAERLREVHVEAKAEVSRLVDLKMSYAAKVAEPSWTPAMIDVAIGKVEPLLKAAEDRVRELEREGLPEELDVAQDGLTDWASANLALKRAFIKRAFPEGLELRPSEYGGSQACMDEQRIYPREA